MIYTYRCQICGHNFSKDIMYSKYVKNSSMKCPNCKSYKTVRTYVEPPAVVFKGKDFTKSTSEE